MSLGGSLLQVPDAVSEPSDDVPVAMVVRLFVQVQQAIDQRTHDLLHVGSGVVTNIAWVAFALAFDEVQEDRRYLTIRVVKVRQLVAMAWIQNLHGSHSRS